MEWFWHAMEFLRGHGNTMALAITWVGIGLVWWQRRTSWLRKEFTSQVNFSLNYIADNCLVMRTLLETTAQKVILNELGVKLLTSAAAKTTESDPFIRLADSKDRDFINRAVLNVLSERFAETFVAAALGVPVKSGKFCFAITCEKYADIRTLKVRVLLIEESTLQRFAPEGDGETLKLADPKFRDRIRSLEAMYKESKADQHVLGHLELGVVTA
jgi:hypothetical protein